MNILMVTNTFAPHVGGVARSVAAFAEEYRRRGHSVLVVAPTFPGVPADETDVVRVRALQQFNGSDFSVVLGPSRRLAGTVDAFAPDIVHSHHPFLLGSTAMRLARRRRVPLVFTHHTFYERYTHYVRAKSPTLRRFAIQLTTNYANLSSVVFAPSKGVAEILRARDIHAPIRVVPTGIPAGPLRARRADSLREMLGIPADVPVAGTVGRLAEEKNLSFLARALVGFLVSSPAAFAVIVGDGPLRRTMEAIFHRAGVGSRIRFTGTLESDALAAAYRTMDVFAFSSLSETQGMVLAEAMAAGVPVVALAATGVEDVVSDGVNGRLLQDADEAGFAAAIAGIATASRTTRDRLARAARATATDFTMERTAAAALAEYAALRSAPVELGGRFDEAWRRSVRRLRAEWDLASAAMGAASAALSRRPQTAVRPLPR